MALALKDRVKETTIVVGTGAATLLGSSIGFQPFSVVGDGNTTYYCISDQFGSNWEVGIGTYSSSGNTLARTTVLASSNAGALVVFTAGVKDVFVTYPSEKGVWYDASGNVLFTGTTTAANLAYTGTLTGSTGILNIGSGQLYKDASGNVGIGSTPAATNRLQVSSTGSTRLLVENTTNTVQLRIQTSTASALIQTDTNHPLTFAINNGSEVMRLDTSGNVGIGTSSPERRLHAYGTGTTIKAEGSGTNVYMQLSCNSQSNANSGYIGYDSGSNLLLLTNDTERMRIDSAGNVGIGTSSPTSKLDIGSGNLNFSGTSQRITGDMSNTTITNRLAFQTSTANANTTLTILPNGTSVASSIVLEGDSAQTNGSYVGVTLTAVGEARITSGIRGTGTYLPITMLTGGSERLRIDSSGNVGIGLTSPTGKLDVAGTIKTLGYTVTTLPTGVVGARAYVTDALTPVFGATVVTGGAVTIPVFYNGTNWIVG